MMANTTFEKEVENDEDLKVFCSNMFLVWDYNPCLQVWLSIINRDHLSGPV
jgi:hypothetical protein